MNGMTIDLMEDATVRAFIIAARRDRYLLFLGDPKKRAKIRGRLHHCHDFDARYATAFPSTVDIPKLLRSHGAGATCHVISGSRGIDGQEMPIEEAVAETDSADSGSLLCCVPGRLAFYIGESGEQRLLLWRDC